MPELSRCYVLFGTTPTPADSLEDWYTWMESADRCVAKNEISGATIETVFLGENRSIDHHPRLFETMILGGPHDGVSRYAPTWDVAEMLHEEAVEVVRNTATSD